ncbi:MAG TPA: hypothetical protein VFA11_15145 [Acidimicrobiales bacterium]|nr:hypothetical protein [Acidimicrobiales bacterium]
MHARAVTFRGATDIDAGLDLVREQVIPMLKQQKGYRGISVSADRAGGVVGVLTMWDTEADRDASESSAEKARQEAARVVGGEISVETFEHIVQELAGEPPSAGSPLTIMPISMDPSKVDDNIAFFQSTVAPEIKATPGFRALRLLINRQSGRGVVGTVWANEDSRRQALEAGKARQARARERGVEFGEPSLRQILLAEFV